VQGADPTLLFDLTQEQRAAFGLTLLAQADGLSFVSQEVSGGTITASPPPSLGPCASTSRRHRRPRPGAVTPW